ncbi:DNRLRE domain-containing protein [Halalkalibacter flavus]|uniref:golvesin C-terminal-like domain-containing protein n=1 Tax=Halalkalibacter flavus TaxID=3090668 RepID=UPI002FC834DD
MQGAGHTLTSSFTQDHGFPVSQDLNNGMLAGFFNHVVLSRAEHIDEVEQILIDTNDGGGFNQSFARNTSTMISVFDRWGNEAELKEDMIEWQTNLAHQVNEYYVNEVSIFPAVENAYVRQSAPDSTFNDSLRVGQDSVISYLKFDLGGITGKPIKSVKVRLTESSSNGTGNTNFEVTKTIEDWNEDSVTWETKPETDGHVYGTYSGGQLEESEVIEIDLPLDSGFLATDGIYEIALGGSVKNEFALKDTLDGAKMIVEYDNLNDIIVDNKRMTADSGWWNSTAEPNYNEFNYYYRRTSSSESKGRWTPYITNPGMYEVYYWLPDGTPNRTTQAPYTIQHADGAETFYVDQTVAGGEWIQLGDEAFPFEAGLNGYVEISNIANGEIVIADSIRFIKVDE